MIRHHLNDELLMAYSAGQLPEAFNLIVASHISLCDDCRARLATFDALGGALLEELCNDGASPSMAPDALSATMNRIAAMEAAAPAPSATGAPAGPACKVLPAPLRDYVGGGVDSIAWRSVGGGVRQSVLPTSREASARLLFIPGGVAVPAHSHRGIELTLVLQGAFRDEQDRFARGDIEIADAELHHTPVAEAGDDCICLAVTDAPLRFNGLLPRIAQPFLRI